uniref:HTH araC/xylS-type domain-containing protein n=1 Tax=Ectopseudomonas oleovorans TaxID=301 RepID=A0A653BDM6_ECTOL
MSVPNFHLHFRTVTDTSPMQYLKSTRLHQALMLRNDLTAAKTAYLVGYESASQFSRDFKRFFGRTPLVEVKRMKQAYALPEPATLRLSCHRTDVREHWRREPRAGPARSVRAVVHDRQQADRYLHQLLRPCGTSPSKVRLSPACMG